MRQWAKRGLERDQERVWKGVQTGLEWEQKRVLKGIKNGISPNSTIWNGVERPFFAVPHLSSLFSLFHPFFFPFFTIFEKNGIKRLSKNGGMGKERKAFFPVSFLFPFFPFLSKHISSSNNISTTLCVALHWAQRREYAATPILPSMEIIAHDESGIWYVGCAINECANIVFWCAWCRMPPL